MIKTSFSQFIIITLALSVQLSGQQITIKGRVTDARTHQALSGANIILQETKTGTSADINGYFDLHVSKLPVTLQINFIGYEQVTMKIENDDFIEIKLSQIVLPGESVNVRGTSKQLNITESGEMEIFSIRQLEYRGFRDAAEALGEAEGIYLERSNEGSQKIRIRGSNVNEVTVFIDGIKLNNSFNREANISFVDLGMVENLIIKKGGITTLYGPGNYGGVVFVDTEDPDKTYIKGKKSFGLTEDSDLDQIISAGVNIPFLAGNYYRSVRKRKFDGVNIYSSYFRSASGAVHGQRRRLSFKYLDLVNQVAIKDYKERDAEILVAGDSLVISQINYSGDLIFSRDWYITIGNRNLLLHDKHFSNYAEKMDDSTTYAVILKKWKLGSFDITGQYEQEKSDYGGTIRSLNIGDSLNWDENLFMSQLDKGWAGIVRHNFPGTGDYDSLWFEVAMRQSTVSLKQDQNIVFRSGDSDTDTLVNNWVNSHRMSTLRFGFQANELDDPVNKVLYINQGFNYNAPTLSQYLLLGNGRAKLEREEKLIRHELSEWVHEDTLELIQERLNRNLYNQSVYPDSLVREYVTSSEIGIRMMSNNNGPMLLRWEFTGALFYNRLSNKLVWRNFGNDIIVPDNIPLGSIFGGEVSGAVFYPHFKLSGSVGYVHPDQDILYQVLPKTSGKLTMEWYWKSVNIVLSNYYQGRVQAFRGFTGMLNLPPVVNTNLNMTVKYEFWKVNLMLTYTIQNVFDNNKTYFEYGSWNRNFNYYDAHRKLLTLKGQVDF